MFDGWKQKSEYSLIIFLMFVDIDITYKVTTI